MNRYCFDMGDIFFGQETGEKVIVRNVGFRFVFVKFMVYVGNLSGVDMFKFDDLLLKKSVLVRLNFDYFFLCYQNCK